MTPCVWVAKLAVFVVVFLSFSIECHSLNCTDECCYRYTTVVNSIGCSVDGHPVAIPCQVLAPDDPQTNVSVRWYKSEDQETARVRGISLLELNTTKYSLDYRRRNKPISTGSDLFRLHYTLFITDFNTTDFGYYWYQAVVNGSCLIPSPYGHIYENTTARPCSTIPLNHNIVSPLCAGSDSSPDNCSEISSKTTEMDTYPTTSDTNTISDSSFIPTIPTKIDNALLHPFTAVAFYSTVGSLVFIITIQAGVIILLFLTVITYKRRFKKGVDLLELQSLNSRIFRRPLNQTIDHEVVENVDYAYSPVSSRQLVNTSTNTTDSNSDIDRRIPSSLTEQTYQKLNAESLEDNHVYSIPSSNKRNRTVY